MLWGVSQGVMAGRVLSRVRTGLRLLAGGVRALTVGLQAQPSVVGVQQLLTSRPPGLHAVVHHVLCGTPLAH